LTAIDEDMKPNSLHIDVQKDRRSGRAGSWLDIPPHPSGAQLSPWSRSELVDEMLER
jgi:hypothetical protein